MFDSFLFYILTSRWTLLILSHLDSELGSLTYVLQRTHSRIHTICENILLIKFCRLSRGSYTWHERGFVPPGYVTPIRKCWESLKFIFELNNPSAAP